MRIIPLALLAVLPLAACAAPAPNAAPAATVTVTVTAPANAQKQKPVAQPSAAKPAGQKVRLPRLVGVNGAIAQNKLEQLGLENVQFGSQDDADKVVLLVTNWTVVKQSPKPGTKVGPQDLIVLTMTKKK